MTCRKCGKEVPAGAAVCPACGTSVVPDVAPRPTVTVVPPAAEIPPVRPVPPPAPVPPEKRRPTAARIFVILFTVLAIMTELGLAVLWFWPAIPVTDHYGYNSLTLWSMHAMCREAAPYFSYILPVLCAAAALFTLAPLLHKFAEKRKRLPIPKLCTVLIAACYALPYLISPIADSMAAVIGGGTVSHINPFTAACLALFILLYVVSDLTVCNMRLVMEHRIEDLRAQLRSCNIQPKF